MSLACRVRHASQIGKRCDPPNATFTSVRELTNHLYAVHHVAGAEATIEARTAATEAYPGRDLKPTELTSATSATARKEAPMRAAVSPPKGSSLSTGSGERKCGGCGRPGTRRDFCPVCNPQRKQPTARADVTRPSESPIATSVDGSRATSVSPKSAPPRTEPSPTSPARTSPARTSPARTSPVPVVPEDKAHVHKRLNYLGDLLRQAVGVLDAAQGVLNELRGGLTK